MCLLSAILYKNPSVFRFILKHWSRSNDTYKCNTFRIYIKIAHLFYRMKLFCLYCSDICLVNLEHGEICYKFIDILYNSIFTFKIYFINNNNNEYVSSVLEVKNALKQFTSYQMSYSNNELYFWPNVCMKRINHVHNRDINRDMNLFLVNVILELE